MKKGLFLMLVMVLGLTLFACGGLTTTATTATTATTTTTTTTTTTATTTATTTETPLTSITFGGVDDLELEFDAAFNIFTGVTATGNNDVDYTDQITFNTTSDAIALDGTLDTTQVGVHAVRYQVTIGDIVAQRWRYITVKSPEAEEGQMLVNPDFSQGTAGWDDPSVVYIADGAQMTLSVEDGALKAEVVAGANAWTPRFGQMNVPFDNGITYEVSFRAKSSVAKTINLQVGELISTSPYFIDFKPGLVIHKDITTEWATYSYKFTMNQAEENHRGGLLFELGTVGTKVDANVWFDDIAITESTPDADTIPPVITGVKASVEVAFNGSYNAASGVTAYDATDGDVTSNIEISYLDGDRNPIEAIDFAVPGTYYVVYTVEDEAGNIATEETELVIRALDFSDENLVTNGSFDDPLNETTPEWSVWVQDWGTPPSVMAGIDNTSGVYNVNVSVTGGDAAWAVQLSQAGLITLEQGKTYRVQFMASASADRTINLALGYDPGTGWIEFARFDEILLTATPTLYEYIFTVTQETHAVNLVFELGATAGFAEGTVTFYDVAVNPEAEPGSENYYSETNLVLDPSFDTALDETTPEWGVWSQDWGTPPVVTAGIDTENGVYNVGITVTGGDAAWAVQLSQAGLITLEQGKTYRVQFTVSATADRTINLAMGYDPGTGWIEYFRSNEIAITGEATLYEFVFTVTQETHAVNLVFELGATSGFAEGTVTFYDVTLNENVDFQVTNLVLDPSFDTALDETTPEWGVWSQDWGTPPVVTAGIDTENGVYNVGITVTGGDAAWAVQLAQTGLITLDQGVTYRLRFIASASVERTINVAMGYDPGSGWIEYFRSNELIVTEEAQLYTFVFTVQPETHLVNLVFELGTTEGFAEGTVTFYEVALNAQVSLVD